MNNMSEYMTACDCIITKAGPGTIAEALICGRPILLNGLVCMNASQASGHTSSILPLPQATSLAKKKVTCLMY